MDIFIGSKTILEGSQNEINEKYTFEYLHEECLLLFLNYLGVSHNNEIKQIINNL